MLQNDFVGIDDPGLVSVGMNVIMIQVCLSVFFLLTALRQLRSLAPERSRRVIKFEQFQVISCNNDNDGEWLHAIPVASMWPQIDDEAVRIDAGLGIDLCVSHRCPCGSLVDASHNFTC